MSYQEQLPVASASRGANGASVVVDTLNGFVDGVIDADARFMLSVTAASGTNPTLNVKIVGVINGIDVDLTPAFAQKTAAGVETIIVPNCPRYVKFAWTIGGTDTPLFTFSGSVIRS